MISVIIPVLNEAAGLAETLRPFRGNSCPHEVIVVDGQSTDRSREVAEAAGARVLICPIRQRAVQMNWGAQQSRGEAILFLHADTWLPPNGLEQIERALRDRGTVGGGFARRFRSASLFLRATCAAAEARTRFCGWFLGDQAIFVRAETFHLLGGYRDMTIFEDLDLARRMRAQGRTVTLRPPVTSSARRFEKLGPVRVTLRDVGLTIRYILHLRRHKG